jgi:hypothetical protein
MEDDTRPLQVSEFLRDVETGQETAKALADALIVNAEAGSEESKVRTSITTAVQCCIGAIIVLRDLQSQRPTSALLTTVVQCGFWRSCAH